MDKNLAKNHLFKDWFDKETKVNPFLKAPPIKAQLELHSTGPILTLFQEGETVDYGEVFPVSC